MSARLARTLGALLLAALFAGACGEVVSDAIVRGELESVACLGPADCPSGQSCILPRGVCVASCGTGGPCGGDRPFCDAETGICRGCASGAECAEATPYCSSTGACVACRDTSDCAAREDRRFCDSDGRCVECLTDGHCDDDDESCNVTFGVCAARCSTTMVCAADDEPFCDFDVGFCVECRADAQCEPGELCRGFECVDPDDDDEDDD